MTHRAIEIEDEFVRFKAEYMVNAFLHAHPEHAAMVDELVTLLLDDVGFVVRARAELRFSVVESTDRPI